MSQQLHTLKMGFAEVTFQPAATAKNDDPLDILLYDFRKSLFPHPASATTTAREKRW
jgi:hypothetical protein